MTSNNCDIDITDKFLASKYCFYIFKYTEKQTFLPQRKKFVFQRYQNPEFVEILVSI